MKLLIDSHVLIWATVDPDRLSRRAHEIFTGPSSDLAFSIASLWELTIKIASGRLQPLGSSIMDVINVLRSRGIEILPIGPNHLARLETLPKHQRDPFDRLLAAQAIEEGLAILTADKHLRRYPVKVVW